MSEHDREERILRRDPLREADEILSQDFYGRSRAPGVAGGRGRGAGGAKPKPSHYKVICISLYTEDLERLEATVVELKRRGYTKANKSQLIRFALSQVDIDKMPPREP